MVGERVVTRLSSQPRGPAASGRPHVRPQEPRARTRPSKTVAPRGDDALGSLLARSVLQRARAASLPDTLRGSLEAEGGVELSGVRVHYDSPAPAGIGARAFAAGLDIHLGPGQERHLAHEAWHVVQQQHGRVRPTQRIGTTAVNADPALEREAAVVATRTLGALGAAPSAANVATRSATATREPVVQGLFDWAIDRQHNRRKVGVEITEGTAGNNRMYAATPTVDWTGLDPIAQQAMWRSRPVYLKDAAGNRAQWLVAPLAGMTADPDPYFDLEGSKSHWMSWGTVKLTEDHGEFEWIIGHPPAPEGVTYYRDRLGEVQTSRAELRSVLKALPPPHEYILSHTNDAAAGSAFAIMLGDTNAASSQITFESTDAAITKTGLMEGLSAGLVTRPRTALADADADVVATIQAAAARSPLAGVDMELVMAYVVGDLAHKIATMAEGAGPDWLNAAANFKDWRMLFPKSLPSQIIAQANTGAATPLQIRTALATDRANIIADVIALFARKLHARTATTRWHPADFTPTSDPADELFTALHTGALPGGGLPALEGALATFLDDNVPNFMTTEFTNVIDALAGGAPNVVRSSSFAVHAGGTTGFAFEDRAEVQTSFPGLSTTYDRIKAIVDRY